MPVPLFAFPVGLFGKSGGKPTFLTMSLLGDL
jgi:hypothetical protein